MPAAGGDDLSVVDLRHLEDSDHGPLLKHELPAEVTGQGEGYDDEEEENLDPLTGFHGQHVVEGVLLILLKAGWHNRTCFCLCSEYPFKFDEAV